MTSRGYVCFSGSAGVGTIHHLVVSFYVYNSRRHAGFVVLQKMASDLHIETSDVMYFKEPYISNTEGHRLHDIIQQTYRNTRGEQCGTPPK